MCYFKNDLTSRSLERTAFALHPARSRHLAGACFSLGDSFWACLSGGPHNRDESCMGNLCECAAPPRIDDPREDKCLTILNVCLARLATQPCHLGRRRL